MPSSIFFNGQRVYRPGTYVRVEDTLSAISSLTAGNIALVGDFPIFKQGAVTTFASYDSMLDSTRAGASIGSIEYGDLARIAFNSLASSTQQIDSLSIINTRDSAQAFHTTNGLTVKSKLYGSVGNNLSFQITENVADSTLMDVTVKNTGTAVETMRGIGDGGSTTLKYSGIFADEMTAQVTATHLEVQAQKNATKADLVTALGVQIFNKSVDGTVSIRCLSDQAGSPTTSAVISGKDSDGTQTTETIDLLNGQGINFTFTSSKTWSYLEDITISNNAGDLDGNLAFYYYPKQTALADIVDLAGWLSALKERDDGFVFVSPSVVTAGSELDRNASSTDINGTDYVFKTNLQRLVDRVFNASAYLEATKTSNQPTSAGGVIALTGGTVGATTAATDWDDALSAILHKNINIIVPATGELTILQKVRDHCKTASEEEGRERNCWLGTPKDLSIQVVHLTYVKGLDDRNCAVVCQGITGLPKPHPEPWYAALTLASIQASTPIAEPMTRKVLNLVTGTTQVFDPEGEANNAIRKSIVLLTAPHGAVRVERSVTTYLKNPEHPAFTEVSANESINSCMLALRNRLDIYVGLKATIDQAQVVQRAAESELSRQRDLTIIANYKDVSVTLVGDVLNIVFDVAATEPLNFITVTANLGQF